MLILGLLVFAVYINTTKDNKDNEFVFKELIMNALNGKYHKYCSGWDLEAHICKNGETNCCQGNFINNPIHVGFIEGNCKDFEFESNKDEITIKLTPFKEVEVKKQSFGKILSTYIRLIYLLLNFQKQLELNFCPKSLEIHSFRGSNLLAFDI